MAGAGFKDFADGNVLTGAELDTYLMQQTVMQFASFAVGLAALAGVVSNGMEIHAADTGIKYRRVAGAWKAWESPRLTWAPVWRSGSGGAVIAIGNGTDTGWYRYSGGMIEFNATRTRGTTTNAGGTDHVLDLPASAADISHNGSVTIQQSGGVVFPQTWLLLSTSEIVIIGTPAGRLNNTGYMKPDGTRNALASAQIYVVGGRYTPA